MPFAAIILAAQFMDLTLLKSVPEAESTDWLISTPQRKAGVFRGSVDGELVLDNGLIRRSFWIGPNLASTGLKNLQTGEEFLRAIRPECELTFDGEVIPVGGLIGQPAGNYLLPEWMTQLKSDPQAMKFVGFEHGPAKKRFEWQPREKWISRKSEWPPKGVELRLKFEGRDLECTVHYELYDGLPLIAKWFTVTNRSEKSRTLDTFKVDILSAVEPESEVEKDVAPKLPKLHVESEFTSVSMTGESSQRDVVKWRTDPTYKTQVNYNLETPCLLEVAPPLGPARKLEPGESFESFRSWTLVQDSREDVRQSLALAKMYRAIAPWSQENPLIFHVRSAEPKALREAVDQAASVGFELVIMTFGSGFNIENESPDYLAEMKSVADYAHSKGIAIGGYSLLASRSINAETDVVNPETGKPGGFATFGSSPCVESKWGQDYFRKLRQFYEKTGMDVLEHDGSYPGDACASTSHPGHTGYEDSRYRQWETVRDYYRWSRSRGIYLNVPDWYFLNGSSKTGMGYRETNWSLPRAQQEIIERQNIHDGTRFKTPTMGWMFVPLSEYHGGGAAATIEPLHEHIDHYERRLKNLLGAGVQACYRGPRLYDTPEVQAMVKRNVDWFKKHRAILESDLIPLRRADGRDWDGWIHVNPSLREKAMAVVYNPLSERITRKIRLPLYYASLTNEAGIQIGDGKPTKVVLKRDESAEIEIAIPAQGSVTILVTNP